MDCGRPISNHAAEKQPFNYITMTRIVAEGAETSFRIVENRKKGLIILCIYGKTLNYKDCFFKIHEFLRSEKFTQILRFDLNMLS